VTRPAILVDALVMKAACIAPGGEDYQSENAGLYDAAYYLISEMANNVRQHSKGVGFVAAQTTKQDGFVKIAKRVLFLADRVSLVNQAANAFKKHLPDSSPVNLVLEKDKEGRAYVCTYPTMMGLIDTVKNGEAAFSVGHFDLVIIDEAHRSIYQKYRSIFAYFDSLLVGLTATPREEVDRNTYDLFDLEAGVPTDAYELERAVLDGFLVPPRVEQVDMKFPRRGIRYDELSDDDKAHWEELDWGDNINPDRAEDGVNASAINKWLFNADTVDKVLQTLMERGHKVAGGDRLAKTIIFARNHDHAVFIEERFNFHYPHLKGHFARVIDNKVKYPQTLIDDFSIPANDPHIAISVDMLDTGIDVPEVANLVFFKPVYSKTKFWQMIGRGTRLCPDLFGPGEDKKDFRVFDFCFNFDYFRENPDGIEGNSPEPLGTRIFKARVGLLARMQQQPDLSQAGTLAGAIKELLKAEVGGMNHDNFLVRMHLRTVEAFQQDGAWTGTLDQSALHQLQNEIAGLPSANPVDELEARMFDHVALCMQIALVDGMAGLFEGLRRQVVEIASQLEEKTTIPDVRSQLAYLQAVQETSFWEGVHLDQLEDMRLRLRGLVQFIDKKKRKNVYSDFEDEIEGIRVGEPVMVPTMTGPQYEKKVREYLKGHLDHIVIGKLRQNQPLTPTDLEQLESMLIQIGEDHGKILLDGLLQRTESPSLVHFVRRTVGMDRAAVQRLFAEYLQTDGLTSAQIRFIETLIDQLTANGIVEQSALYDPPFSDVHAGGPDELFHGRDKVIEGIFDKLKALEPGKAAG
jgi:type I restriction enzyme R subunit